MGEWDLETGKTLRSEQKHSRIYKQNSLVYSAGPSNDRILHLQRTAGNQAVQKLIKSQPLQAKFRIGWPKDIYKQEADRVDEKVISMPDPVLQRKRCAKCDEDEKKALQAKNSLGQMAVNQEDVTMTVSRINDPVPMNKPTVRKIEECEKFPGGEINCQMDEKTGLPTGKVLPPRIYETNPCTKPCVEQHEAVHEKQMKKFCIELRDCYLLADKGKRSYFDCMKMAIVNKYECQAYNVSVSCLEDRLRNAKNCQSKEHKEYGKRKLASEKCFRDINCE